MSASNYNSTGGASHLPSSEAPPMSTGQTLVNIFFEPGSTFASLRVRPRFLVAAIVTIGSYILFSTLYFQKIGYETIVRAQTSVQAARNPTATSEQLERGVQFQLNPAFKVFRMVSPVIFLAIVFAAGAGLYLLGTMLTGKSMSYRQALSVWAYSSLPPTVLLMVVNIILLFVRPPEDEAAIVQGSGRGLAHANLSILVDTTAHPVIGSVIGAFDVFAFYGLFLAAVGLTRMTRMSSGTAWSIVLGLWLIRILFAATVAAITGSVVA